MGIKVKRTRCNGQWTESQFHNFIRGALRRASTRWAPIHEVMREARVGRGAYLCAACKAIVPLTVNKKRNVYVDHIAPITNPEKGFTSWDELIEKLFCEKEGLQVLCSLCHDDKTGAEREQAKERRKKNINE